MKRGRNVTVEQFKTAVYDQWLFSDLREIGSSSFPNSLATCKKTVLVGNHTVQVMGVRDVSQPAYGQLMKIQGKENENANVAAAPANSVPVWEAKSKRMLLLSITDGSQYVQAMEYQTISSLSVDMPPGIKLLLSGPIECRLGVLMLVPDKVKILGGDVESLTDVNSHEIILARQLKRPDLAPTQNTGRTALNLTGRPTPVPVPNAPEDQKMQLTDDFGDDDDDEIFMRLAPNYLEDLERQNGERSPIQEYIDVDNDFPSSPTEWNQLSNEENSRIVSDPVPKVRTCTGTSPSRPKSCRPPSNENPSTSTGISKLQAVSDSSSTANVNHVGWESLPFTYLHCIMEQQTSTEPFVIKGFISSLTSKLTLKPDSGWRLEAFINDGSASLEVVISNEVLSKFIGLTVEDVTKLKQESRNDPSIKLKINEGIVKCQETLMNLNCLMKVQLHPEPTLLRCAPVERYHIRQLLNRIVTL